MSGSPGVSFIDELEKISNIAVAGGKGRNSGMPAKVTKPVRVKQVSKPIVAKFGRKLKKWVGRANKQNPAMRWGARV